MAPRLESASDAPAPESNGRNRSRRRGGGALLAITSLTAVISALFLIDAATIHPSAAKSPSGVTTLNVAKAAAVAATSSTTIEIKNYAFAPASVTVAAGTEVTWVNEDSVPHTVTTKSGPASFDSGQIASGASYSVIFESAGTYSYYCIDHPQMVASVTVTGSSGGGSSASPSPSGVSSSSPVSASPSASASATASTSAGSSGMPMPSNSTGTGGSSDCASLSEVLLPLLQHINATHLGESPGQQVTDLLNVNQYVLTHTTLVVNVLTPLLNSATTVTNGLLVPLLQHLDTTHLGESPGQQVNDLLNLDQYVLTHTTLIEKMIEPTEGVLTGSC
jgi:plastocyanin